ncbi:MAG: LysR substrate-binding domain-containing protein [Thiolinea sp.]
MVDISSAGINKAFGIELRHLRSFIVVAEEGNIGRAATRLNISQPPLTRQIHQLEQELGVQLLIRTPHGVELTAAGALFLEEARTICTQVRLASEKTQRAGEGKLGRLDIAIFGSAILRDIPQLLLNFHQHYPDVSVVLHTMAKGQQIEALRQRRINAGFNRLLPALPDIASELIATDPLLLAINDCHPLAQRQAIPLRAIAAIPLILFPTGVLPNFREKTLKLCKDSGFTPQVAQEVGDVVTAVAMVASGFGVALVPEAATVLTLPHVVYKPLDNPPPGAEVDLTCIYRANDPSPVLAAFLTECRKYREQTYSVCP